MPSSSWVRPKQPPNDKVEVFGLGEPDAEDDTGDILGGRYELLKVLACGGTATVYRARDRTTRSVVAVKVLYKGALAAVGEFLIRRRGSPRESAARTSSMRATSGRTMGGHTSCSTSCRATPSRSCTASG